MTEERAVEINEEGRKETRVGIPISDGPETFRILLTRPLAMEGRIQDIPVESIEAMHDIQPGPRGEPPDIVEAKD